MRHNYTSKIPVDIFHIMNQSLFILEEMIYFVLGYNKIFFIIKRQYGWEGSMKEKDPYVCVAESLRCSPESITTLLIGCIPTQSLKC